MTLPDLPPGARPDAHGSPGSWIPAIRAGDAEALARWYRAEHPAVWRLCLGFLAERAEADDAAQDAMLKLLDTLDRFDARRPWAVWRNSVVLNHCRDRSGASRCAPAPRRRRRATPSRRRSRIRPDEARAASLQSLVTASLRRLTPREREAFCCCTTSRAGRPPTSRPRSRSRRARCACCSRRRAGGCASCSRRASRAGASERTVPERDDDELALDELRAAWRTLAPDDPSARVDSPDAATQAALEWMRAAWQATASDAPTAPPLRLPWRLRLLRGAAPPAAARAVARGGGVCSSCCCASSPRRAPHDRPRGRRRAATSSSTLRPTLASVLGRPAIVPVPDPITVSDVIPLTAVDAHRMEMRHGPVRLILVMPTPRPDFRKEELR
jgi:RNA polymerase sigma factor (sigma-70 family)